MTNHISPAESLPVVQSQETEYRLLVGHSRTDGSFKTSDQLRSEYIQRTDTLIHTMTDGINIFDPNTGETTKKLPDFVVWLDKSARPLAWLTRELWPKLAPEPDSSVMPKKPDFRFVNIDREQWVNSVDPGGTGYMDINRIDKSLIRSLRSIFIEPRYKEAGLTEAIDTAPAELDGKTVLIIDEVRSTGRTLEIAQKFFERAFPTATIATDHWMGGIAQKGLGQGNADIPVWYKDKDETGRGIANRDESISGRSNSITQRLGSWFLSTRFPQMDPASVTLRKEIHKLAHDEKVLIVPSFHREVDDLVKRAEKHNNVDFDQFLKLKNELGAQSRPK